LLRVGAGLAELAVMLQAAAAAADLELLLYQYRQLRHIP
jgi:hypothetical protein